MRNLVLALAAAGGLAVAGSAPAEAVGTRYPFCMQGDEAPALSDCRYTSYEQCAATASGRSSIAWRIPITVPGIRAAIAAAIAYVPPNPPIDQASGAESRVSRRRT